MNTICETNKELIDDPKKDTEKVYYVYHLIDPRNDLPFYIGKGKDNRMYNHEKCVSNNKIPNKNNRLLFYKIRKILSSDYKIIYKKIMENLESSSALLLEISEIKKYGRINNKTGILCNMTDGGDGNNNMVITESTRKKISLANKNRIITWGNKISNSLINNPILLKERNEKISHAHKGKTVSEKTKAKQSVSHKGKKDSEETKINKSIAQKNRIYTEEELEKIRKIGKNNSKIYDDNIIDEVRLFNILFEKPYNVYEILSQIYFDLTYLDVRKILKVGEYKNE